MLKMSSSQQEQHYTHVKYQSRKKHIVKDSPGKSVLKFSVYFFRYFLNGFLNIFADKILRENLEI